MPMGRVTQVVARLGKTLKLPATSFVIAAQSVGYPRT